MPLSPEQRQALIAQIRSQGQASVQQAQPILPANYAEDTINNPSSAIGAVASIPLKAASALGEAVDPYSGAPVRAAIGDLQSGGNPSSAVDAYKAQITAGKVLPSTPTGEAIALKGMQGYMSPEFAAKTAKIVGPAVNALTDPITAATAFTPEIGIKALQAAPEAAQAVTGAARTASEAVGNAAAEKAFQVGKIMTQGNINPALSMRATKNLSAVEQTVPWLFQGGAGADLAAVRAANAANPAVVEGSGAAMQDLANKLGAASNKAPAPNMQWMAGKIQDLIKSESGVPKDLTAGQLDELLQNTDNLSYTPQGNSRSVQSLLQPDVTNAKQTLRGALATSPEGQVILDTRARAGDLLTAGKGRGKLLQAMSWASAPFTGGKSLALDPMFYHRVVGLSRLPKQAAESALGALDAAYNSGGSEAVRATFNDLAQQYPTLTEGAIREAAVAPGRAENNQPINVPTTYQTGPDIPVVYATGRNK